MDDAEVVSDAGYAELLASARMLGMGDGLLKIAHHWPLRVVLEIPVIGFTVRTLMELHPGMILETDAASSEDVLLRVNGQVLGPAKFDVTGQALAVRLTGVV